MTALSVKDLMAVGAHFGHHKQRRNPKMIPFIHSERGKVHIIDLKKTLPLFVKALNETEAVIAKGGRVLFVGTKRQASDIVQREALRCGQHYVNSRWLGGTLTNWETISKSIKRMNQTEKSFGEEDFEARPKKEQIHIKKDFDKLQRYLGGIKNMGGIPDLIFVIDTNKESIAVAEAHKLGIPIVALVDTNCNPDPISLPIPANDDALKSIEFFTYWMCEAVLKGLEKEASHTQRMMQKKHDPAKKSDDKKDVTGAKAETASKKPEPAAVAEDSLESPVTEKISAPKENIPPVTQANAPLPAADADRKSETPAVGQPAETPSEKAESTSVAPAPQAGDAS